jgi:hypothetical protein
MTAANRKPRVEFRSSGEGGNIYAVLARCRTVLRGLRRVQDYNDLYCAVTTSDSYTQALARIRGTVDLVDLDGKY